MNIVQPFNAQITSTNLADVLNSKETAFIGRCGTGPEHELYLVFYAHIILAKTPNTTWSIGDCPVVIDRYVDVRINVVEKDDE